MTMRTLVRAQLRSEIRDKTILARSLPFVGVVLLLFAFAFDPDRGVLSRIAPGLWWVTTTFAAMFIYVRDAHNKRESGFIAQFGIDGSTLFVARIIVNSLLTGVVTVTSGLLVVFLFSPDIENIFALIVIAVLTTVSLSTIGAIYSPLIARLHDSGQLLSLVVIPILLPCLLAAIRATEAAMSGATGECWQWISLIAIFVILFGAAGALAADSLED
ncbi:MAG TPA: heme exporter protein CcmB [Acidimicrobiia bacterium]|nr:heme exporter protein CcmB [Acidimicrobiia bacterium]